MQIDIQSIDRDRFHVNKRHIDGIGEVYHIVPHKAMWSWHDDEVHLRSLLTDLQGNSESI